MPTFNIKKIRRLLKAGRAKIVYRHPFTVMLAYRGSMDVQPVEICQDAGYMHIGISVKSEKHEYAHEQYDLLPDEKQRHDNRRKYRRMRRSRLRYRKPRFDNRKRPEGWFAPSIENKMNRHIDIIEKYRKVCPVTSVVVEVASFDTQLIEAMETGGKIPEGTDYQHGPRYLTETLRDAVFFRDKHTCLICGKNDVILRVHHIGYWKTPSDHTDRMRNLATVCVKCHTPANHKPGGKLYGLDPKLKPLTGASFMNIVRGRLVKELRDTGLSVTVTYGSMTKVKRHECHLPKTHANDAYAMGKFHPKHKAHEALWKKNRRNNRILERFYDTVFIDIRDKKRKKGAELSCGRTSRSIPRNNPDNMRIYRGERVSKGRRQIRRKHYIIQAGDTVSFNGIRYTVKGMQNGGSYIAVDGRTPIRADKTKVISHTGGWKRT